MGDTAAAGDSGSTTTDSILTLSGASNTDFGQGSTFSWDISADGASYDKLETASFVDGGAAGGSVFQIVIADATFADTFWDSSKSWSNIFTTDGSTVSVVNSSFESLAPVGGSFSLSGSTLSWSAVPEPSSGLVGLLIAAGLLRRRRA